MSADRASLKNLSTTVLTELREAISSGLLRTPVDHASLVGFGIRHQLDAIGRARGPSERGVTRGARRDARRARGPPAGAGAGVDGPRGARGDARDTAVVLRSLFEGARESVILAGYSFDHAEDVLAPLHVVMRDHQVSARFFVDIPQIERHVAAGEHLGNSPLRRRKRRSRRLLQRSARRCAA